MTSKVGRPPRTVEWKLVDYNDASYLVAKIQFNDIYVHCVIDADFANIREHSWHVVTGSYIGCYKTHEGKRKTLYLHNFIMGRDGFNGKGQEESIDHINGIGFDNRHANLRQISQSLQNINTRQRTRTVTNLPPEINAADIPRNVWYIPPSKTHGARFCVEFKGVPGIGDIVKKTTSSKEVSIVDKLKQAKEMRQDIIEDYPVLLEHSRISDKAIQLKKEYENIVALAEGLALSCSNDTHTSVHAVPDASNTAPAFVGHSQ